MKTWLIIIAFGILVYFGFSALNSSQEPPEPGSYHNEAYGFWIKFPDGWQVDAGIYDDLWSVTANEPYTSGYYGILNIVRVAMEEFPYKVKLDFFQKKMEEYIGDYYEGLRIEDKQDIKIAGKKTKLCTITFYDQKTPVKALWCLLTNGKRGYMIIGITSSDRFDGYRDTFEEAIRSFRLD